MGVTLALSFVGKYLFSDNLATFFDYLVSCSPSSNCKTNIAFSDVITVFLLIVTNMVLWSSVKRELY